MSSLSDEFQVVLPSNVKGYSQNQLYLYETKLAKQLDRLNKWDFALIDISYSNNWTNLNMSSQYFLLRKLIENVDCDFVPKNKIY